MSTRHLGRCRIARARARYRRELLEALVVLKGEIAQRERRLAALEAVLADAVAAARRA